MLLISICFVTFKYIKFFLILRQKKGRLRSRPIKLKKHYSLDLFNLGSQQDKIDAATARRTDVETGGPYFLAVIFGIKNGPLKAAGAFCCTLDGYVDVVAARLICSLERDVLGGVYAVRIIIERCRYILGFKFGNFGAAFNDCNCSPLL